MRSSTVPVPTDRSENAVPSAVAPLGSGGVCQTVARPGRARRDDLLAPEDPRTARVAVVGDHAQARVRAALVPGADLVEVAGDPDRRAVRRPRRGVRRRRRRRLRGERACVRVGRHGADGDQQRRRAGCGPAVDPVPRRAVLRGPRELRRRRAACRVDRRRAACQRLAGRARRGETVGVRRRGQRPAGRHRRQRGDRRRRDDGILDGRQLLVAVGPRPDRHGLGVHATVRVRRVRPGARVAAAARTGVAVAQPAVGAGRRQPVLEAGVRQQVGRRWRRRQRHDLANGLHGHPVARLRREPVQQRVEVLRRDRVRVAVVADVVQREDDPAAAVLHGVRDVALNGRLRRRARVAGRGSQDERIGRRHALGGDAAGQAACPADAAGGGVAAGLHRGARRRVPLREGVGERDGVVAVRDEGLAVVADLRLLDRRGDRREVRVVSPCGRRSRGRRRRPGRSGSRSCSTARRRRSPRRRRTSRAPRARPGSAAPPADRRSRRRTSARRTWGPASARPGARSRPSTLASAAPRDRRALSTSSPRSARRSGRRRARSRSRPARPARRRTTERTGRSRRTASRSPTART